MGSAGKKSVPRWAHTADALAPTCMALSLDLYCHYVGGVCWGENIDQVCMIELSTSLPEIDAARAVHVTLHPGRPCIGTAALYRYQPSVWFELCAHQL